MVDVLSIQEWIKNLKTGWNNHKRGTKVEKKKNRGNEPNQVIIHIYMKVSQGNSLCSDLKQAKISFPFPFFWKIGE
jgi:hypothetical protein